MRCQGMTVLVVGGSRGIGLATAEELASEGAKVLLTSRDLETAEKVARAISDRGGDVVPFALDVTDPGACSELLDGLGPDLCLDGIVANAGINPYFVKPTEVTPDMWDEIFAVNARGIFFAVQAAGSRLIQRGRGSVVIISSVTANIGTRRGLPYVATKGAVDAMTRTLALEWAGSNVRVNSVAPGYVETDLTSGFRDNPALAESILKKTPLGRFGRSQEIASMIAHLISPESSYITGQVISVDGGMTAY